MGCDVSKQLSTEEREAALSASDPPAAEQADAGVSTAGASHSATATHTATPGDTKLVVTARESLEASDGSGYLQQVLVLASAANHFCARQHAYLQTLSRHVGPCSMQRAYACTAFKSLLVLGFLSEQQVRV